jgi:ATP-dependent helicase/nuclease subunit A
LQANLSRLLALFSESNCLTYSAKVEKSSPLPILEDSCSGNNPSIMPERTSDLELEDSLARQRIREDLTSTLMVEAAAGTGKTTCIVDRMVNLIANDHCRIEQLAAVTFTRKAAVELKERFQLQLRLHSNSAAQGCGSSTSDNSEDLLRKQRLDLANDRYGTAFVGTIHSFCAMLLRERPIEFGVDPAFRELTAEEDNALRQQAWLENIQDLMANQEPLMDKLDDLAIDREQLKGCFETLIQFRDITDWAVSQPRDYDIEFVKARTNDYIDEMKTWIPLFPMDRGTDALMAKYEDIVRASQRAWRADGSFFQLLELFDTSHGATQKFWHDKSIAKASTVRWDTFRKEIVRPALDWWTTVRYQFVVDFVCRAVKVYNRLKAACGGLDFTDLLLMTAKGLRGQPQLRHYFRQRFTHLLVDEFQDTDPIQAELFMLLTADDLNQSNWQACRPRAGSLFIVGDPKQSIYRFRRGDIVTYNRVKEILIDAGGVVVPLIKNFRSHPAIIDWNNSVFAEKFPARSDEFRPASEPMLPGRTDKVDGQLVGIWRLEVPTDSNIIDATYHEADAIARYIRHAIDSGLTVPRTQREIDEGKSSTVQAGDFLIIPRTKKRMAIFRETLNGYGIPCEISGGNAFAGLNHLQVLIDCLRSIDDSLNPVHYLAILRDRLFGFSDADLFAYKQAGGSFNYAASPPIKLEQSLRNRFADVHRRMMMYQNWLRSLPFATAVQLIASDLGLLAIAALGASGDSMLGSFLCAIESVRIQSSDFDSASDLILYFEQLMEIEESDSCPALPPDANVVRVMNLHKAKGLEAPVVFLADTGQGMQNMKPRYHIDRRGTSSVGYLSITREYGKFGQIRVIASPENWPEKQTAEMQFIAAEDDRLLYVATTRAACQLIVSVGKDSSMWNGLHGHLQGLPSIDAPSTGPVVVSSIGAAPSPDLSRADCAARWQVGLNPSYSIATAKVLGLKGRRRTKQSVYANEASNDGKNLYGHLWGSAVHELLDVANKNASIDLSSVGISVLCEYRIPANRLDELLATVRAVIDSNLWQRARSAKRCYSELPFETLGSDEHQKPMIVRGVMDLIFQEHDEEAWVIVDYKTDHISPEQMPMAIDYYRGQLTSYVTFWKSSTGFDVKELGLYFTRLRHYQVI